MLESLLVTFPSTSLSCGKKKKKKKQKEFQDQKDCSKVEGLEGKIARIQPAAVCPHLRHSLEIFPPIFSFTQKNKLFFLNLDRKVFCKYFRLPIKSCKNDLRILFRRFFLPRSPSSWWKNGNQPRKHSIADTEVKKSFRVVDCLTFFQRTDITLRFVFSPPFGRAHSCLSLSLSSAGKAHKAPFSYFLSWLLAARVCYFSSGLGMPRTRRRG